jgi:hypothetical protein
MEADQEIQAMGTITTALAPLEQNARDRVLSWAAMRFGSSSIAALTANPSRSSGNDEIANDPQAFDGFAELFAAAEPKTDKERALVAAYWIQNCENQPNFASQTLNTILKDLGHGVGHITDALEALKDEKPALILQLKKSGTTKQARKTYKLTHEGTKRVLQMTRKEAA